MQPGAESHVSKNSAGMKNATFTEKEMQGKKENTKSLVMQKVWKCIWYHYKDKYVIIQLNKMIP